MTPDDRADTLEEIDEAPRRRNPVGDPGRRAPRDEEAARVRAGHRRRPDDDRVRPGFGGHDGGSRARQRAGRRAVRKAGSDAQRLHDRRAGTLGGRDVAARAPRRARGREDQRHRVDRGAEHRAELRPRRSRACHRELRPRRRARRERVGPPDGRDHGRRRHRRDSRRADGRRPEARRYGGARRAVHADVDRRHAQEARGLAVDSDDQRDVHDVGAATLRHRAAEASRARRCSCRSS